MNWTATALDARSIRMKAQRHSLVRKERKVVSGDVGSQARSHLSIVRDRASSLTPAVTDVAQGAPVTPADAIIIPPSDRLESAFGLTSREAEVARLLVWGDSNKAIAKKLSIQPGTVRKHVEHVLRKIDACSRRTVARVVLRLAEPV